MVYVVSDIHGCYDKYVKLLKRLNMGENDTLHILGDIVDRGDGGIKILLDIAERKNICSYKGNHDYCAFAVLKNLIYPNVGYSEEELVADLKMWFSDGGKPTFAEFFKLSSARQNTVLSYINLMPLYNKLTIGGKKFFLAHTVPEKEKILHSEKCRPSDFIIGEPEYNKKYFDDTIIVTGHTPTGFIDLDYTGRIWKGNNHIAIDCGAVFGNSLGCICLDTMEEIYVK